MNGTDLLAGERRWAAIAALAAAVWYWALVTGFGFDLFAPVHRGMLFNAMLLQLLQGRVDVPMEVIGEEGFLQGGRVIAYFGILPALLRAPLLAFPNLYGTDLTRFCCVLGAALAGYWQVRAVLMVCRAPGLVALRAPLAVSLLLAGPHVSFLRASIYEEALHWTAAFAALFVLAAFEFVVEGVSRRVLAKAALAAGLCFLVRPTSGTALVLGFGVMALASAWPGRWAPGRWVLGLLRPPVIGAAALLAPFVLTVLWVNYARWGNPFTVVDVSTNLMNARFPARMPRLLATGEFNLERLWFGLQYYFAPIWVLYVPGSGHLLFQATMDRLVEAELPPASFFLSDPLLVALAGWGATRLPRPRLVSGGMALALTMPCVLMLGLAFMNFRYRQEFYPLFVWLALMGLLAGAPGWLTRGRAWAMTVVGVAASHLFLLMYLRSIFGPADLTMVQQMLRRFGL